MADGPGGKSVGRVSVRVVPDTSKFGKELRAQLEKINAKVQVEAELDQDDLDKKVKAAAKKASGEKITLKADLDSDHLTRETKNAKQVAQKRTGEIKLTAGLDIKKSLAKIWVDLKAISTAAKAYSISIPVDWVGLSKGLLIAGALSATLLSIPHIVAGIGGAVQVVGGLLATLPALAAGAAAGIAAVAVGLKGMGAALKASGDPKKFAEALKTLAPSAQAAAKALATFREPLHDIRMSVQQKLFEGMDKPLLSLKKLLPPIKGGLSGIAEGIKDMGVAWIKMATSQKSVKDTWVILGLTQSAFQNARPALANFGQALKDIAVVGASFLPKMGLAVGRISDRFATWAANARESGRMAEWITTAWEKLKQFGRILADIVAIFRNFSSAMRGGRDLGDIIEGWTTALRDLVESAKGQQTLKNLASVMRELARVAGTVFKAAFNSISDILQAATPFLLEFARSLGGAVVGALRILTPMLQGLFQWLSDNKAIMAPLAVAITGVVTAFKLFATVSNGLKAIKEGLTGIKDGAMLVWDGLGLVKKGFGFLWGIAGDVATWAKIVVGNWIKVAASAVANAAKTAAAWIGQMARTAAITAEIVVRQVAIMIAEWAKMAAAALLRAGMVASAWIGQMTLMVSTTVSRMATVVAAWVAGWVTMAAVALANAARMAIAWLIAMGPIALIIAAVIALVALIILNWDTIKAWTVKIFTAIWDFIVMIFNTCKDAVVTAWKAVLDFFRSIPGWIGNALSTLGDILSWPFRKGWDLAKTVWDKAIGFFRQIGGWLSDAVSKVGDILAAPFEWAWKQIKKVIDWIKGAIDAIGDAVSAVGDFVGGLFADQLNLAVEHGAVVPVAFGEFDAPTIPSVGFEPYAAGDLVGTDGIDHMLSSVNRARRSLSRANSDLGVDFGDQGSIADQIAEAMSGWTVQFDRNGVAKMVNKTNTMNARRR
jgi:phage-related protein